MQIISRNNYEEYFLLYVDNELNAEQQLTVENFVQQNPDLAVEFDMLMNTKFPADTIEFVDKENLLRTEGNSINETNHEEYFLLYIDNELSTAKRQEVEMYVLQHPRLQDEFITLKQAVLAPEIMSYGDKQDLYRTEKRRVIYFKPWRLAAAAVFIGVCAIGLWLMQESNNLNVPVAINKPVQTQPKQNLPKQTDVAVKPVEVDTIKQQTQQPKEIVTTQSSPKKEEKKTTIETAVVKKKKENIIKENTTIHKAEDDTNNQQEEIAVQHPVITHNNIAHQQKQPPVETHDVVDVPEHIDQNQNNTGALHASASNDQNTGDYKIYPVAYKEINTNDEDRSLRVGMLDLNKDKVKTLFKKAGRFFGNKSNNLASDDGKLQVANFEIETRKQ